MASPLPIHHQWCIADKLLGSNKPLLRGWPHWWKQKLPHGHPSIHSPVSSIQQSVLVSVQGNSYQHYYFSGVVCARVHWQKRTNTQFVFRLWVYESASARRQRWKVESEGLFSQHAADVRLYSPLQTAPGFISRRRWQIVRAEYTFLGVLMQIFAGDTQRCLYFFLLLRFSLSKDQLKGFV